MTEVNKGLMTSKELGMAVADRLRQGEKRPETPGSEPTPKQQALMRRALQPPATREQQKDRHAENQTKAQLLTLEEQPQHRQKDLSAAPAPANPDNHSGTQAFGVDPSELREVPFYVLLDRVLSQGHDPHSFLRSLGLKPYSFLLTQDHNRQTIPGTREYYDLDRARVGFPPITDEEWKEREEWKRAREEFDRLPPGALWRLVNQWLDRQVLPDSKTPEQRTFWKVIGGMIIGLIEGAAQSRKDKPAEKK